jgi:hypothetical protein
VAARSDSRHGGGGVPSSGQLAARARRAVSCFLVCSTRKLWPVISTKCAPWVRRFEGRRGEQGLAEEVRPLGAVAIRSQDNGAAFVALVDDIVEILRAGRPEGFEPEVAEDEQIRAGVAGEALLAGVPSAPPPARWVSILSTLTKGTS